MSSDCTSSMPAHIEQTVTDYFAAISAMDANAYAALFAPDGIAHDPVGTPPHQGTEALRAFLQGIGMVFRRVTLTPHDVFVAGHSAAVQWTAEGTGQNGKTVAFAGIDVLDFNEEGKIQTMHGYWDAEPVMAQLQS